MLTLSSMENLIVQCNRQQTSLNDFEQFSQSRSTKVHHLYTVCTALVIYASCKVSRSSLLIMKKIFKGFTICWSGGHLGHVTWTINVNVCSPFPR